MRTYLLSFLAGLLFVNSTEAQTTWTGAIDQNWHNAANWSNGLPAPGNDALIPNVVNDPVISESTEFDYNVELDGSMTVAFEATIIQSMNISSSGVLNLAESIFCNGQLDNHGEIHFIAYYKPIIIDSNAVVNNYGVIYNPYFEDGSLINHGIINNYESGVIHVNNFDILGIDNYNLVVNHGLITGLGFANTAEFINYGTVDIIEDRNAHVIINHGTYLFDFGLILASAYFHNTECGYVLKQAYPGPYTAIIDLNDGIVVDLDSNIIILENNGIYSTSLIPDTTIITCFDTIAYLDDDGLVTLNEEMLFTNFGCTDTIVLMSDPDLDCSNVNEQVEIQIGYLEAGEPTYLCSAHVIVLDTIPPYLIDSLGVFFLTQPGGECAFTIELIAPLAADNCDFTDFIFFYEFFPSPASLAPGDTFTIIYSTEDEYGNEASFVHTGVVPLDLFPVMIVDCPGDVELEQTPLCPVGLFWNEPLVINTCNIVSVSSTYSPGDTLLPGTYIASYEYLDNLGALHTCTFELVVVEQDTVFVEVTLCEDDVVVLPWDGSTVSESGMYCFTDSICGTTTCLNVTLIPSISTEIDTVHCPGDSLAMPPGTYTYTFLSSLGCDSIVTLNVSFCTAVTSPFGNQEVKVYPNPIHELITLECNRWEGLLINYELMSTEGKPILTGTFEGVKAVIQMPRSINGVVILKIFDGRQSIFQKLVVMPE